jgi:TolB-like protein
VVLYTRKEALSELNTNDRISFEGKIENISTVKGGSVGVIGDYKKSGPIRTSATEPVEEPAPQLPAPPAAVVQEKPREHPERSLNRGLETLVQQLAVSLPEGKKLLLAVLDFNDLSGNVSVFGRLVNEELVTKLFQTGRTRVVERGVLEKALSELEFNLAALVDPSRAKQLGKQARADAIVTGSITDLGSTIKINARLIEVEKGDILAAAGAEIAKDPAIVRLMEQPLSGPLEGRR